MFHSVKKEEEKEQFNWVKRKTQFTALLTLYFLDFFLSF